MSENKKLLKFAPITKIDENTHTAYGLCASETPDKDREVFDYIYGKAALQKWSSDTLARTVGSGAEASLGNIRIMHGLTVGGKVTKLEFKDDEKQVWIETQPANEEVWQQLKRGMLSAFSVGGSYAWKRKDGDNTRYGSDISEISYVDNPANPDAVFTFVRTDGSMELRKFAPRDSNKVIIDAADLAKLKAAEFSAEVNKFNPNHDGKGEFSSGGGGSSLKPVNATEGHGGNDHGIRQGEYKDHRAAIRAHDKEAVRLRTVAAEHDAAGRHEEARAARAESEHHLDMSFIHREIAEEMKADAGDFGKTRVPSGQFTVQNSGETHDFLVSSGYTHERTGESQQAGIGVKFPLAVYQNKNQAVTVHSNGYWEHDNGHQVRTTGSGLQDLKLHMQACMAVKDEMDKGDHMTAEQVANIEGVLKRFHLPFTAEHLERMAKGDGFTVAEEEAFEAMMTKSVQYLVPDGNHLPYTDANGNISHRLMGAAWAALHGGYRGNKYEGSDKDAAISKLKSLYEKEGLPTPGIKAVKSAAEPSTTVRQSMELESSIYEATTDHTTEDDVDNVNDGTNPSDDITDEAYADAEQQSIDADKATKDAGDPGTPVAHAYAAEMHETAARAQERVGHPFRAALHTGAATQHHSAEATLASDKRVSEGDALTEETKAKKVLVTPAAKTAVNSNTEGDDSMKHVEELVKAAKGLASHFKAAEAHHLKKAEHHEEQADTNDDMAECHKAAMGHHKAQKADDLAKGMATHHEEMHKLHKAAAGHHRAHAAIEKAFAAKCGKAAASCEEGAEKTVKAAQADDAELAKSVTDLSSALTTGFETLKGGFGEMLKTEVTGLGLGDLVKASVAEAIGEQIATDGIDPKTGKPAIAKASGLKLVGRDGKEVVQQSTEGVSAGDSGF